MEKPETTPTESTTYTPTTFNKTELKDRGWTDGLIKSLLKDVGKLYSYDGYGRFGRFEYSEWSYPIATVLEIEQTEIFQERKQKLLKRRETRATAANDRINIVENMTHQELLELAPKALHIINRKVKHRTQKSFSMDDVYRIKDKYLNLIISAGLGRLEYFEKTSNKGPITCPCCEKSWYGYDGSECFQCGMEGELDYINTQTWHLFHYNEYCWHMPNYTPPSYIQKYKIPEHNPTQEAKEIPAIKASKKDLTQKQLFRIVERTAEVLEAVWALCGVFGEEKGQ